jgi:hypothetical protein
MRPRSASMGVAMCRRHTRVPLSPVALCSDGSEDVVGDQILGVGCHHIVTTSDDDLHVECREYGKDLATPPGAHEGFDRSVAKRVGHDEPLVPIPAPVR